MTVYAIGDIQGCYQPLQRLLETVAFDARRDQLWFAGDLVNRGPHSLETLRFVRSLGDRAVTVLGNHDLHLLAVAAGTVAPKPKDHLDPILEAPDRNTLLEWLRHQPLFHHDTALGYTMIHAGLPPQWDLDAVRARAAEVETALQGPQYTEFLRHMYGNQPDRWSESLNGWERLRFITNCFTRLRYCTADGTLELKAKGPPGTQPAECEPWFAIPGRASRNLQVVFGHWSTLTLDPEHTAHVPGIYPLDTGCFWGRSLTAMELGPSRARYSVPCAELAD